MDDEKTKDPQAVELGRRGGLKGGPARASKLSAAERSASARDAARARWSLPRATHEGELPIGRLRLPCYVLENGQRVLSLGGMLKALGIKHGGNPNAAGADRLARFAGGQAIGPYLSEEMRIAIGEPLRFRSEQGSEARGYEAVLLAELCTAITRAKREGRLQKQQLHIADRCELLRDGFATVGLVALIDEATGYQVDRARDALARILEAFIAKELARWVKTFPDEFYKEMFRLRGLVQGGKLRRPRYFGLLTNDVVYSRLAPGVLAEMQKKNPVIEGGRRGTRHHQWLTRDIGHPKLQAHLAVVSALMRLSKTWRDFIWKLNQVAPQFGTTYLLPFPDADTGEEVPLDLG